MKGFVSSARWAHICALILVAVGLLGARAQAAPAAQAAPQLTYKIYLPSVDRRPLPANQPASQAFFLPYELPGAGVQNINSTDLVVDALGGVHLVYEIIEYDRRIAYAYCPSNCVDASKFTTTVLAAEDAGQPATIYIANLKLDGLGRPRIMWQQYNELHLVYCNSACASAASWTDLTVHAMQGLDWLGQHFAIDQQGGYHYVYGDDEVEGATYYLYCPADCTDAASWTQAKIADREYMNPSLALTSDGRPRFVFQTYDESYVWRLGYAECDANCLDQASWAVKIFDPFGSSEGSYTLQLDKQNRPRVALSPWWADNSSFPKQQITYMWCNLSCASAATAWPKALVPVPGADITISSIAMALDAADRPAVAFNESGSGMMLARCTGGCESAAATWTTELFDSTAALNQSEPVPPKSGCSYPTWSTGYETNLVFDSAGRPRVAYDTNHLWLCGSSVSTDIKWARYKQW
jgi:hypothetical protein